MTTTQISKKRKFVADGIFFAELNAFFIRELAENGYSGVEVRVTPQRTEIIIQATKPKDVLGEKGRRIRELTAIVQKRFNFPENTVELYAEKVSNRGLCSLAQCESLKFKLVNGLAVRKACYGVMRYIMENGAKGCEVQVSGKLRAQRAKCMKFRDGYMLKSGYPTQIYIDTAIRHVLLRQGILGIKVQIMLPHDPTGKQGPKTAQPDVVRVLEPKEDDHAHQTPHGQKPVGYAQAPGAAPGAGPHGQQPPQHGGQHGGPQHGGPQHGGQQHGGQQQPHQQHGQHQVPQRPAPAHGGAPSHSGPAPHQHPPHQHASHAHSGGQHPHAASHPGAVATGSPHPGTHHQQHATPHAKI